ncbi:MAG: hypothetical protein QHH13_01680 [Melioribacter sp.]|uniref:hypothetical protein n=1 Tax=Rosettibacter primus TaxID=3111523 RepID=UPI00247BE203|nr:hypothetical protein [Melioribacter sp.]
MKKIKISFLFLFVLYLNISLFAQFEVEFNKIEGSLEKSDKYQKNFGRYDGYEIQLYEGEEVNFLVYSDKFTPRLVFVNPEGKVFKETLAEKKNIATIITKIPVSGEWILYVVGDSTSLGSYTLQLAVAAVNSISLPQNSDFCTTLNFLLAHSKAYFLLLETPINSKQSFVKLNGSVDAFIDENDGSYIAKFYEGNDLKVAEKILRELISSIKNCLSKNWKMQSKDWQKNDDYKIKGTLISEIKSDVKRYIQISLIDFKNSRQKFMGDYVVQVEINRMPD